MIEASARSVSRRTVPGRGHGDLFYPEDLRILANILNETLAALSPDRRTIADHMQIAKLVLAWGVTSELKSNDGARIYGDFIDRTFIFFLAQSNRGFG
ncbi:hypothetical protein BST63_01485 [Bradyrhizobium canariense]|uniref:Uncharacterized protein n=1 Tax=Bradyrhizobium canariense TaxID=255045 RepID=A0ABX3XB84_9BRAD|nr:hypothetical protein [Bradyrhizobium canariense]OSJ19710.1 hypothetical protein BSR47_01635 [Bradyrhizobium canariense]OSJ35720.1 hypothetical protein BST63_01485 [Bradyrhizobium canariense]